MPSELRRKPDRKSASDESVPVMLNEASIRDRAYQIYETRGREQGHDLDDWLEAERQLQEAGTIRH
jgi:DUF2934 family protein